MSRARTKKYIDVFLKEKDIKRIKEGYAVVKRVNGAHLSLKSYSKDRKTQRRIEQLKAEIKKLKAETKKRRKKDVGSG